MAFDYKELLTGYEDTKLVTHREFGSLFPDAVRYDSLGKKQVSGVLKADYYDADGNLRQLYSAKDNHVCVVAATRQGKTTSYVIPALISYARQAKKRHLIITDPKGEIYCHTAETLKAEGYSVKLLNFRDYKHSEYWNPLTPIYRRYMDYVNIWNEVLPTRDGNWLYKGRVFESFDAISRDPSSGVNLIMNDVSNMIDEFVTQMIAVESKNDPTWEYGARSIVKGALWGMLEDTESEENPITEDTYSIRTLIAVLNYLSGSNEYLTRRSGRHSRAYETASPFVLDTAKETRSSFISVMFSKITEYCESTVQIMTSCNTIDFSMFGSADRPVALFIDFRDEARSHYNLIALFIQRLYTYLIDICNRSARGAIENGVMFMLDEFGNMPPIKDFSNVISACGSRNIWFTIILQSYAQLAAVYDQERQNYSQIIIDNLNVHIFMGGNNLATKEQFSKECGQYTRISPLSALRGNEKSISYIEKETIPVVPVSVLSTLAPGECVITEVSCPYVMLSMLVPYFAAKEFMNLPVADERKYASPVDPMEDRYFYKLEGAGRGGSESARELAIRKAIREAKDYGHYDISSKKDAGSNSAASGLDDDDDADDDGDNDNDGEANNEATDKADGDSRSSRVTTMVEKLARLLDLEDEEDSDDDDDDDDNGDDDDDDDDDGDNGDIW